MSRDLPDYLLRLPKARTEGSPPRARSQQHLVKDPGRDYEGLAGLTTEPSGDELRLIPKDLHLVVRGFESQELPAELDGILGYIRQDLCSDIGARFSSLYLCSVLLLLLQ